MKDVNLLLINVIVEMAKLDVEIVTHTHIVSYLMKQEDMPS